MKASTLMFRTMFRGQTISSGFKQEQSGKFFMKQINAVAVLLAVAALTGMASAQTKFMINSVNSGQVLDVPAFSTTPGTLIQQWPANGGTNQQWIFRHVSGTNPVTYEIVSSSSGQVLDVPAFSTTPGTLIQQWPANGGINQQWMFGRAPGSSGYEIVSKDQDCPPPPPEQFGQCFNLVLDVPGFSTTPGTHIQQWTENDGPNQQWLLQPLPVWGGFSPGISMVPGSNTTFAITGWGFRPSTLACPVVQELWNPPTDPLIAPCATVLSDGTFSTSVTLPGFYNYDHLSPNYVVATIEDNAGNVSAIGSVQGSISQFIR